MKPYFTLLTRDGDSSPWSPQFGDYTRASVEAERQSLVHHAIPVKSRNTKIIRTDEHQSAINSAVRALNNPVVQLILI
jgi:hypothetical protein